MVNTNTFNQYSIKFKDRQDISFLLIKLITKHNLDICIYL